MAGFERGLRPRNRSSVGEESEGAPLGEGFGRGAKPSPRLLKGGLGLQALEEGAGVALELRPLGARDGVARDELLTEWVDASAALDHLVVEMRPGAQAGRAHVADHLPLVHPRPGTDVVAEPGEMRVEGLVPRAVANLHREAVAAVPAGVGHGA